MLAVIKSLHRRAVTENDRGTRRQSGRWTRHAVQSGRRPWSAGKIPSLEAVRASLKWVWYSEPIHSRILLNFTYLFAKYTGYFLPAAGQPNKRLPARASQWSACLLSRWSEFAVWNRPNTSWHLVFSFSFLKEEEEEEEEESKVAAQIWRWTEGNQTNKTIEGERTIVPTTPNALHLVPELEFTVHKTAGFLFSFIFLGYKRILEKY